MKLPILEFDTEKSIIYEKSYLKHIQKNKEKFGDFDVIKSNKINTCLFVFVRENLEEIYPDLKLFYKFTFASNENEIYIYKNKFLIAKASLGGPLAAGIMEELGMYGITNFYACGSAGLIDNQIDSSAFMLVERAIRDEGTSYKYEKPAVYSYPDKTLTEQLAKYLDKRGLKYTKITTWTTDAFFRETPTRIKKRKKQGAVVVDMECASWCSVAKFYGYKFAQLLYTSDVTKQDEWVSKSKDDRKKLKSQVIDLMLSYLEENVVN